MPTALAISPHLDDAVFSAGGTLAQLARDGWRVVVATVFTASVATPSGFALACQLDKGLPADVDYMALRRCEDAAACAVVGAEPVWLPFAEAPHRGYESTVALFEGLRGDDRVVADIVPHLSALIGKLAPNLLLAPQCVGAHVDHVAIYLALCSCGRPRRLWVDFPYAAHSAKRPSPFADELAGAGAWDNPLQSNDLIAKLDASACYESQLGFQFGGAAPARTAIADAGSVERFIDIG